MSRTKALDSRAHALSAFRTLPNGSSRQYTATTFPRDPWRGCSLIVRQAAAIGRLTDGGDGYAVLDVLDSDGDIIQDFTIPTVEAFQWLKRKLKLAVDSEDETDV